MNKLILALGLCLALIALSEASSKCRPQCKTGDDRTIACVRDSAGKQCRRLKTCLMREENCRLRQQGKRVLIEANKSQCRNIKSPNGTGRCARMVVKSSKNVRRCPNRPCKDDGVSRCWRNNEGKCRVLTSCQRILTNCRNPTNMALNAMDKKACRGMKLGSPLQKCRSVKKD